MHPLFAWTLALTGILAVAIPGPAAWAQQPQMQQLPEVPGVTWTRWQDTSEEHAFTMDVPAGWHVEGGLVRRGPLDYSLFLRGLSPDGQMMLILGDPDPAVFHTAGWDRRVDVTAYRNGVEFARDYVQRALPRLCGGATEQSERARPDLADGLIKYATPGARPDAGEVVFACARGGRPTVAFMVAATYIYRSPYPNMSQLWGYSLLAGGIAPPDQLDAMKQIVTHMLLSSRNNPQWVRYQQGIVDQATRNLNAITLQMQQISQASIANARAQQADMGRQSDAFNEVLTQSGTFEAPGGQQFQMQNTQQYHWFGPGGRTAQTNGPAPPPGLGWQQMRQVAPR